MLDFENKTSYAVAVTVDDPTNTVNYSVVSFPFSAELLGVNYSWAGGAITGEIDISSTPYLVTGNPNTEEVSRFSFTGTATLNGVPLTFAPGDYVAVVHNANLGDSTIFNFAFQPFNVSDNLQLLNVWFQDSGNHSGSGHLLNFGTVPHFAVFSTGGSFAISPAPGGATPDATSATYILSVTDVNDNSPVITTAATQKVPENTTFVAALTSTDADTVGTNPATFSITGGTNAALFDIVGGNLVFKTAPDYETDPHSYQVEVSANDGVNTTAELITVNPTDVNEAPTASALANATASLAENTSTANHIKVADITVTDDALGSNTLALTGADAAAFEIVGTELFLKAGAVLDFESKVSYSVAVTVDDPTVGATPDASSTNYTLAVANVSGVTINGTAGNDTINATTTVAGQSLPTNEEDTINSGAGRDTIDALGGNDFINGGSGSDTMRGGAGNDTYVVDNTGDVVTENPGEGSDTVLSSVTYTVDANVENLTLTGTSKIDGTGNAANNVITGNGANNVLAGLNGADVITGGGGNDRITGGDGGDTLTGGPGNDTFVLAAVAHSIPATPDMITDFFHGQDKFDFSAIDANTSSSKAAKGDQAFLFAGQNADVVANSVSWFEDVAAGNTIIQADVSGDTTAEISIVLIGINLQLSTSDFIP